MLVSDRAMAKAPAVEADRSGRRHLSGDRQGTCGTPQGGVISPLLATGIWAQVRRDERTTAQGVGRRPCRSRRYRALG